MVSRRSELLPRNTLSVCKPAVSVSVQLMIIWCLL